MPMHPETDDKKGQEMTDNQTEIETPDDAGVSNETPVSDDTPGGNPPPADDQPETFPREYVEKLRDENAKYRQRAADRDEIALKLHTALAQATGRLQDASDLPFNDEHLTDPAALTTAVEALLQAKPHLASRKPTGDIGQGVSASADSFSLAGALRQNAS